MQAIAKLLFNLNRVFLLLLSLAFLSFTLIKIEALRGLADITKYSTAYLPILLIPATIAILVVLVLRYLTKSSSEKVNFGDFLAGGLALVLQLAVIILYRNQGNDVVGSSFLTNIPNTQALVEKAAPLGMALIAGLQFAAFFFFWVADPNPRKTKAA